MNLIDLLAKKVPFSKAELNLLIATAPNRYKVHAIEKRNNRGKRLIAQPTAEVKYIQRIVQKYLNDRLPIHNCAKAYRPGQGIKDHADPHAANRFLLKVDFKDFFPSIKGADFFNHLIRHTKTDEETAKLCTSILFWYQKSSGNLVLAIGAPSSPWLSNTILFEFDSQLTQYCSAMGITYTRYADDLALSTNNSNSLSNALTKITDICSGLDYPKLTINNERTVFTSKKSNRTLTGLVLSNDGSVSIGRDKKREIRALANNYQYGRLTLEQTGHLRGLLAFSLSIDKSFNASIERMIGTVKYRELMH